MITPPETFTVVSFHAHPDDESLLTGGTLARVAAEGHRVVLVTATAGGLGLAAAADGHGEDLADRRSTELRAAAAALGCARVVVLGYPDSGLAGDAVGGFATADVEEAAERLAAVLREESADLLTTYDERGGYGHPDHVQVHHVGARAAALAGTPVVLEATVDARLFAGVLALLRLVGHAFGHSAPLGTREVFTPHDRLTHRVRVGPHLAAKRAALAAHLTQQHADDDVRVLTRILALPGPVLRTAFGREWFREPGRPPGGPLLDDVFATLRTLRAAARTVGASS